MLALVSAGLGVGLLPAHAGRALPANVIFKPLELGSWLIRQLKKVRGMQPTGVSKTLDTRRQGRTTQAHFFGQINNPFAEHLPLIATILLSKENH
jgi:hypothetical protein